MKTERIIFLLEENGSKFHNKEWNSAVLLTKEILNKFDQLQTYKNDIKLMKNEEELITEQGIPQKIREYINEKNKLFFSIQKNEEQSLNQSSELNSLTNDLEMIKNQINLIKNEVNDLDNKESELKSTQHHLKKLAKIEDIETNQRNLEKKEEKLKKLNRKQIKYEKKLKILEQRKASLENAPKQKELEFVDLAAFEAPIPLNRKSSSFGNSMSDENLSNHSNSDNEYDDDLTLGFNLNRISLRKKLDGIHESSIYSIKFAHNKSYLATGGEDGTVNVNKYEHDEIKNIAKFSYPNNEIVSIDFSPNDEFFLTSCSDLVIRVYQSKKWNIISENNHNKKSLNHAEFFNSSNQYISCGKDCKIKIFDINRNKNVSKLKSASHPYYVTSSNGDYQLLSGHSDSSVIFWDSRTGKQTSSFKFNKGKVIQVLASPIYSTAVSLSTNKVICFTDLRNLSLLKKIDVSCTGMNSMKTKMALKDKSIIIGGSDGTIYLWSLKSHQLISQKRIGNNPISAIDIKQDTNKMAAGDSKGSISIYS